MSFFPKINARALLTLLMSVMAAVVVATLFLGIKPAFAAGKTYFVIHNGDRREFIVHVPDDYKEDAKLPVVLLFHGGGGNAALAAQKTNMHVTGNQNGFITVYPQGVSMRNEKAATWNAGMCCGYAQAKQVDDVGFIRKLIESMRDRFSIDMNRIYATGYSNGGMMAYRLACELSDKITAIVSVSGAMSVQDCKMLRPVPVMHIHGTQDQCVRYDGGHCDGCLSQIMDVVTGEKNLNIQGQVANAHECRAVKETMDNIAKMYGGLPVSVIYDTKGQVSCEKWVKTSVPVHLCTVRGGGHTWPGGRLTGACAERVKGRACKKYQKIVGGINKDISANDVIWTFFSRQKLPRATGPYMDSDK